MANSTIEQRKFKSLEKLEQQLVVSQMEINFQISQQNKLFIYDPVFSGRV